MMNGRFVSSSELSLSCSVKISCPEIPQGSFLTGTFWASALAHLLPSDTRRDLLITCTCQQEIRREMRVTFRINLAHCVQCSP